MKRRILVEKEEVLRKDSNISDNSITILLI